MVCMWVTLCFSRTVHVVPNFDFREHDINDKGTCWCHPKQDWVHLDMYSHNALDRREHQNESYH